VLQHEHLALEHLDALVVFDVHLDAGRCAGAGRFDAVLSGLGSAAVLQEIDAPRRPRQRTRREHQDDAVSRQAVGARGLAPAEQPRRVRQADAVDRVIEACLERLEAIPSHRLLGLLRTDGRGHRRESHRRHQTARERTHDPHLFCDAWRT
jgi:hypothetical protein